MATSALSGAPANQIAVRAVGPGLAGRILQYMDRDWLMMIIAGSTFVSMLLLLPLAIRLDRDTRAARFRPPSQVGID